MLSDAAVALFLPETDIVNHLLSPQCCRYGAEKVYNWASSRAGTENLSSIPCLCTCILFVLGFLFLAILSFDLHFPHSPGLIISLARSLSPVLLILGSPILESSRGSFDRGQTGALLLFLDLA